MSGTFGGAGPERQRVLIALAFAVLVVINAAICWPLFGVEYLDSFQTNEGSFITFGKFLHEHWQHASWFPWFNAGMPFEDTYLPLVPLVTALGSAATGASEAHAFHFFTAATYALAPAFLFLFAWQLSKRPAAAFFGALAWSLTSPSHLIPAILADTGTPWGSRRLYNIIRWGETPHNVALCFLPLALYLLQRLWDQPGRRRFVVAVVALATVMLSNAFGLVVVAIGSLILWASQQRMGPVAGGAKPLTLGMLSLASAYLLICRALPPSLIQLIRTNSQLVGGDYRFTFSSLALAAGVVGIAILLWIAVRRLQNPLLTFAVLFTALFGAITLLAYGWNLSFLPQPNRYHLEFELGICLLTGVVIDEAMRRVPQRALIPAFAILAAACVWPFWMGYTAAHRWIHPVSDITQTPVYQQAQYLRTQLPGERVLIAGEEQWWFNLFADNPQLGAGHEPSAPNWMQRVAVFTIYSGMNAGNQDGPISVFWLKVFGVGAVEVPGVASHDHYHSIANPAKFDGLLERVWDRDGNSIYRVPLRSTSLAHVMPRQAIVARRPIHGLDLDPVRPYAAALEDASLPVAHMEWRNPAQAEIHATLAPMQVVSVQVTGDRGWEATVGGMRQPVHTDALGFLWIEPMCVGDCTIKLEFTGGTERLICSVISGLMAAALLAAFAKPMPSSRS